MSFGKGASAGFGGAIGVMAAIAIIFVILPSMACFGAIVLMYAMQPPMQIQNPEKPNASDTETDDSKELDDDDNHNSSSDEVPGVSQLERRCRQVLDRMICTSSRQETRLDHLASNGNKECSTVQIRFVGACRESSLG